MSKGPISIRVAYLKGASMLLLLCLSACGGNSSSPSAGTGAENISDDDFTGTIEWIDPIANGGFERFTTSTPNGSPDDVRREVNRLMGTLGGEGGYIVCPAHALQGDTSPENIMAIYDTALERHSD